MDQFFASGGFVKPSDVIDDILFFLDTMLVARDYIKKINDTIIVEDNLAFISDITDYTTEIVKRRGIIAMWFLLSFVQEIVEDVISNTQYNIICDIDSHIPIGVLIIYGILRNRYFRELSELAGYKYEPANKLSDVRHQIEYKGGI